MGKMKQDTRPLGGANSWARTPGTYIAAQAVISGVDHVAFTMEQKWGTGRLRFLVGVDLLEKFDRLFNVFFRITLLARQITTPQVVLSFSPFLWKLLRSSYFKCLLEMINRLFDISKPVPVKTISISIPKIVTGRCLLPGILLVNSSFQYLI